MADVLSVLVWIGVVATAGFFVMVFVVAIWTRNDRNGNYRGLVPTLAGFIALIVVDAIAGVAGLVLAAGVAEDDRFLAGGIGIVLLLPAAVFVVTRFGDWFPNVRK